MALLTDQNLKSYKTYIDELSVQARSWSQYLDKSETLLNSGVGSTFRSNYAKGKKATQNMQTVIDILQSLQGDLNRLVSDAQAFYTTASKAAKQ